MRPWSRIFEWNGELAFRDIGEMRMGATVEECELPSFYELLDRFSLFDSSASSGCDVQVSNFLFPLAIYCILRVWNLLLDLRTGISNRNIFEVWKRVRRIKGSTFGDQIGKNGSLFCKCEGCIRWSDFVEGRDPSDIEVKYEVFTREHVAGLACYLRYVCGPDLVLTCFHFVSLLETDKASSSLFLWQD